MELNTHDLSAGIFARGLINLKALLAKAREHVGAQGAEASLLEARIAGARDSTGAVYAPMDLHGYTLAAHVHWAAEGAKMAMGLLSGEKPVPDTRAAETFEGLHHHIDAVITFLQEASPQDIEAGLVRTIVVERPRGSTSAVGSQFLTAMAIPHFYYHMTMAYAILRNHGVPLRMADFLGDWGKASA